MSATTTNLKEAIVNRRSIRKVTKNDAITKERIEEVLKTALHAPTSFNMQSGRMVVLMDGEHEKFWDIVKETLRARVPAENFEATVERLKGFHAGVGTVLFFEDQATVEKMHHYIKISSHSGLIKEMRCYNILCGCYYLLKELGRHYNITTQS